MLTRRVPLVALLLMFSREAAADGENTPMVGFAFVGAEAPRSPDHSNELAGIALDVAWWHGRFGLAGEGSTRWCVDAEGRGLVLGGSARFRLADGMTLALMDTRQVEVALELQAIVERVWWDAPDFAADPMSYGFGFALRARGAGEPEGTSVLAESRFFLRVMSSQWTPVDAIARTTAMLPADSPRALTVLLGIGASFGEGTSSYMARFRSHPFGATLLQ
jgi:hypothetical protein